MLGKIKDFATDKFNAGKEALQNYGSSTIPSYNPGGAESMHYPISLRSEPRPCIEFTVYDTSGGTVEMKTIWFPVPGGLTFSDGATYSNIDLGALGGALDSAMDGFKNTDGGIMKKASGGIDAIVNQAASLKSGEIAAIASMALPGIGEQVSFKAKTIINPNTNQAFQGNSVRSFDFSFKMIANSQKEANMMKKIHETFRRYVYADSDGNRQNITLAYPPVWRIRFLDGMGAENNYIPKIHSCYLQTFNTSINATNNVFNIGGDPLEIDVTVSYVETRALTRHDIDTLGDDENRGIDGDGQPTIQPSNAEDLNVLKGQVAAWEEEREAAKQAEENETSLVETPETSTPTETKTYTKKRRSRSDIRFKENIDFIGLSPSGLKIYEFDYTDKSGRYQGVMAQDLLEIDNNHPAVTVDSDGYYMVDYGYTDVEFKEI